MRTTLLMATAGIVLAVWSATLPGATAAGNGGEKVKRIEWLQDNAQKYMSTKIYELRHVRASDITPFVEGAVKRYRTDSRVQRLNYAAGKKEYLVVSTGTEMLPYVDEIVKALDRPSGKLDAMGSNIEGTGISNFVYFTKHPDQQGHGKDHQPEYSG